MLSGNGTFYKPGTSEYISNMHTKVSEDELVDKNGNPRKDLYLRRVEVGPGFQAAGTLVTTNKGNSFVVVDQNTERSSISQALAAGLNPLFNGTSRVGAPIPFGQDDQGNILMGTPFIVNRRNGTSFSKDLFIKDASGNTYQTSLPEIYDRILPTTEKSLGLGASKSDNSAFKFQR